MNELERFPILSDATTRRRFPDWPVSVPLKLLAPHEAQAQANHGGQTLARLAKRGGLSPLELLAVLTDQPFEGVRHIHPDDAITQILKLGGIRRPRPCEEPRGEIHFHGDAKPDPAISQGVALFGQRSPCRHEHLDMDGICQKCGADHRGI
jgi:hypothetical protein